MFFEIRNSLIFCLSCNYLCALRNICMTNDFFQSSSPDWRKVNKLWVFSAFCGDIFSIGSFFLCHFCKKFTIKGLITISASPADLTWIAEILSFVYRTNHVPC